MSKDFKRFLAVLLTVCCLFTCSTLSYAAVDESRYTLVYSEFVSTPDNYQTYNCYGYAIGTNQNVDPGAYSGRPYLVSPTADYIETSVIADLEALGCFNIHSVSSSYSLQPGESMIAFAFGWWAYTFDNNLLIRSTNIVYPQETGYSYHFWKKTHNGASWYHKFGTLSSIMKLKNGYTPSNISVTDEYCYGTNGQNISPAAHTMNSSGSIRYIAYTSPYSVNGASAYDETIY